MRTRLALVSCKGSYEGVWTNATGSESGLEIYMLGGGAFIRFDWGSEDSPKSAEFHSPGEHPLPERNFVRYRVSKVGDSGQPTIVRVQLNGQS